MPTENSLQQMGMVQRKPGRGVTTLSVSCFDKIARWNVLGVQGLYSTNLLTYLNTISFKLVISVIRNLGFAGKHTNKLANLHTQKFCPCKTFAHQIY